MNGSGSKHPKIQRDIDIYNFRHEGGIVAAKYDQPGYVHAMRLVVKDDMWSFFALYNTIHATHHAGRPTNDTWQLLPPIK